MSVRTLANGSNFMFFLREGSEGSYTYKPLAGQTNGALTLEDGYLESNAKNLGPWSDSFLGNKNWNATAEIELMSDTDTTEVSFEDLQDLQFAGTKETWVFAWITPITDPTSTPSVDTTRRMYTGKALINAPISANKGEKMTSSITFKGCLELEIVDPS